MPRDYKNVSFAYKEKAVACAEMHPKWNITALQKKGFRKFKNQRVLVLMERRVKRGGTFADKWKSIEIETFEHFKEARECLEQVLM